VTDNARTHLDVLRNIPQSERAALHERSNSAGLLHLATYFCAILLTTVWILSGHWLWQGAVLFQGVLLVFLFTLQHECTHETPFAAPWLSTILGHLCAVILIQPFIAFRYFHLAHHRHTNDPDRDPELLGGGKPETWPALIWHVTGLPYWLHGVRLTLQNAIEPQATNYIPTRATPRLKREARAMLLVYAAAIFSLFWSDMLFWVWILPALIGAPFLRIYLLAEHGRCPFVSNMLENTRTTFTNRFVRWLAWNMPYHIEHHSAPNVPFHQLPALHEKMQDELVTTSDSYYAFSKEYTAQLK